MRQELAQVYSDYWQHLRMDDVDIGSEPTVACRQYLDYVNKHTQRYREELRRAGPNIIFDLHQKEGPLEHQLRWHKKRVQSYEFHRQCADIQGAECRRQTREVQKGSCIIWLDWKQNISLPIQHTETGDSFWAQARAECSVLGIIVYTAAEKGKEPRKRCFVYVSDIIDHTCYSCCDTVGFGTHRRVGRLQGDIQHRRLGGLRAALQVHRLPRSPSAVVGDASQRQSHQLVGELPCRKTRQGRCRCLVRCGEFLGRKGKEGAELQHQDC